MRVIVAITGRRPFDSRRSPPPCGDRTTVPQPTSISSERAPRSPKLASGSLRTGSIHGLHAVRSVTVSSQRPSAPAEPENSRRPTAAGKPRASSHARAGLSSGPRTRRPCRRPGSKRRQPPRRPSGPRLLSNSCFRTGRLRKPSTSPAKRLIVSRSRPVGASTSSSTSLISSSKRRVPSGLSRTGVL